MEALNPDDSNIQRKSVDRRSQSTPVVRTLNAAAGLLFAAGLACGGMHWGAGLGAGVRRAGSALLIPRALQRRSLLVWTFLAMLAGAELGVDAPKIAARRISGRDFSAADPHDCGAADFWRDCDRDRRAQRAEAAWGAWR